MADRRNQILNEIFQIVKEKTPKQPTQRELLAEEDAATTREITRKQREGGDLSDFEIDFGRRVGRVKKEKKPPSEKERFSEEMAATRSYILNKIRNNEELEDYEEVLAESMNLDRKDVFQGRRVGGAGRSTAEERKANEIDRIILKEVAGKALTKPEVEKLRAHRLKGLVKGGGIGAFTTELSAEHRENELQQINEKFLAASAQVEQGKLDPEGEEYRKLVGSRQLAKDDVIRSRILARYNPGGITSIVEAKHNREYYGGNTYKTLITSGVKPAVALFQVMQSSPEEFVTLPKGMAQLEKVKAWMNYANGYDALYLQMEQALENELTPPDPNPLPE